MSAVLRFRSRQAPGAPWHSRTEPDPGMFVRRWIHDFDIDVLDDRGVWLSVLRAA